MIKKKNKDRTKKVKRIKDKNIQRTCNTNAKRLFNI